MHTLNTFNGLGNSPVLISFRIVRTDTLSIAAVSLMV